MKLGYFLSSEEHTPRELLEHAIAAEEAGFESILISTTSTRGSIS